MSARLKAAWWVLRGRPLIYGTGFTNRLLILHNRVQDTEKLNAFIRSQVVKS